MATEDDKIDFESIVNSKLASDDLLGSDDGTSDDGTGVADDGSTDDKDGSDDGSKGSQDDDQSGKDDNGSGDDAGDSKDDGSSDDSDNDTNKDDAATDGDKSDDQQDGGASNNEPLSAEDIKKILDERDNQAVIDKQRYKEISADITSDLYPNGFETNLKDEKGNIIATAEDYQKYIDPEASLESAQRIIMTEQARLNREVQEAKDFISEKAELQNTMEREAVRVMVKYKDYFDKNPDIQPRIAEKYHKTLKVMGKTIVEAPIGLEDFYDFAMKPYLDKLSADTNKGSTDTSGDDKSKDEPAGDNPDEKVSDERLDLVGTPSEDSSNSLIVDGKPNWDKIVKDKMKGN